MNGYNQLMDRVEARDGATPRFANGTSQLLSSRPLASMVGYPAGAGPRTENDSLSYRVLPDAAWVQHFIHHLAHAA